jgi:superfamily II helicase
VTELFEEALANELSTKQGDQHSNSILYKYDIMRTKAIPIDKICRICEKKKLLMEFDQDNKTKDRHETICKSCKEAIIEEHTCSDCIDEKIMISAYHSMDLLLDTMKNGTQPPAEILKLASEIAHRGGAKYYCESCEKRLQ